jgi:hypothetical protein
MTVAARHALPTLGSSREFAIVGGLISYGAGVADAYRQVDLTPVTS